MRRKARLSLCVHQLASTPPTPTQAKEKKKDILLPPLQILHNLHPPLRPTRSPIPRHIQQHHLRLAALGAPDAERIHLPRAPGLRRRPADLGAHDGVQQRAFPGVRAAQEGDLGLDGRQRRGAELARGPQLDGGVARGGEELVGVGELRGGRDCGVPVVGDVGGGEVVEGFFVGVGWRGRW